MTAEEAPVVTVEKVVSLWERMVAALPDVLTRLAWAVVGTAIGILLLLLGRRIIRWAFNRKTKRESTAQRRDTWRTLLLSFFNFIMYFSIAMAVLSAFGVDVSSILAVAGVGGVAIGFGCQTLVKDFVSGLFLWLEGRINVGDVVTVGGQTGMVEAVALRTTTLRAPNGKLFVIPNGDIRTVINMSRDYRCALVDITAAHGQDLNHILALLRTEMEQVNARMDEIDEAPQVLGVISSDGRAATIRIESRCDVDDVWKLESEIRLSALECFRREGIKP